MPFLLRNVTLTLDEGEELLAARLASRFGLSTAELSGLRIVRRAVDARRKGRIVFVHTVTFGVADEAAFSSRWRHERDLEYLPPRAEMVLPKFASPARIVIVGSGPAGLFAALRLTGHGLGATLLERGRPVTERVRDVQAFWTRGELNPESNVQFGEGGAGTFSDGKLTTRVRDPNSDWVLDRFVSFGAPAEIRYLAKPHIGTDRLRGVVAAMRQHLVEQGVTVRFSSRLTDLLLRDRQLQGVVVNNGEELPCDCLILAPGHSARDTYEMLARRGVRLEAKPFAVGLRVEHPQELVNRAQYGMPGHPRLPPADYALTYNDQSTGRSAYSFCMCPGGIVVAGSSEKQGVVTNGMSAYLRNSPWANSALVVNVRTDDFNGSSPLAGIEFQRSLERRAFVAGGGAFQAPAQGLLAFLGERGGKLTATYRPGVREADLGELLPPFVTATLRAGVRQFDRQLRGFISAEATLTGVESRTSSPVRIVRDGGCQAEGIDGLFPAGEGAGYAGGIMSAALDGIRVADAIVARLQQAGQPL